jgi:sugar phosphate isomerase/epimerase
MNSRRKFIRNTALFTAACNVPGVSVFPNKRFNMNPLKISLAQWSLHRALESGQLQAGDFAAVARNEYDITAIEYVNSFYQGKGEDEAFWQQMRERALNEGVQSLLIMVDGEGDLADPKDNARLMAVENHHKWIHAVKLLGGHSIRINAFGTGERTALKAALVDSLGRLVEYAGREGIYVLIENHGLHTSDAGFIVDIIKVVDNPFLGTLPDFGNWCLDREWGSTANNECESVYDPANGLRQFLPYARGVSAKSYAFNREGYESVIDYPELLRLVKNSGYNGHIGIEYEGTSLPEPEGIRATKVLLETIWKGL